MEFAPLKTALQVALITVAAPIDVIIDAIIIPYATDRYVLSAYYRTVSADIVHRLSEYDRLLTKKKQADALATMIRYPSFISDELIADIRAGSADACWYSSIQYEIVDDRPTVCIAANGSTIADLIGCPNSDDYGVYDSQLQKRFESIDKFVFLNCGPVAVTDFLRTGRFAATDNDLAAMAKQADIFPATMKQFCLPLLPVVHAHIRLDRFVNNNGCIRPAGICVGCRKNAAAWPTALPTVDDLFDS